MFNNFSPSSKIWIYQSDRILTDDEVILLNEKANSFVNEWAAHKVQLKASATVHAHLFLILVVDEQQASASGCSIDSSVRFVKDMEVSLGVSFFDRLRVAYESQGQINIANYKELVTAINEGNLPHNVLIFDNTITSLNDLQTSWRKPISQSWLAKFLNVEQVR
jgi:hypothetical protein